jgi:uncharacterized protein YlbG (UPF0298 family)
MINREPIIVYYKTPKLLKTIKDYGHITYFHKKRHYAVVYVNSAEKEDVIKKIRAIRGIKYVDESHLDKEMYTFDLNVQ